MQKSSGNSFSWGSRSFLPRTILAWPARVHPRERALPGSRPRQVTRFRVRRAARESRVGSRHGGWRTGRNSRAPDRPAWPPYRARFRGKEPRQHARFPASRRFPPDRRAECLVAGLGIDLDPARPHRRRENVGQFLQPGQMRERTIAKRLRDVRQKIERKISSVTSKFRRGQHQGACLAAATGDEVIAAPRDPAVDAVEGTLHQPPCSCAVSPRIRRPSFVLMEPACAHGAEQRLRAAWRRMSSREGPWRYRHQAGARGQAARRASRRVSCSGGNGGQGEAGHRLERSLTRECCQSQGSSGAWSGKIKSAWALVSSMKLPKLTMRRVFCAMSFPGFAFPCGPPKNNRVYFAKQQHPAARAAWAFRNGDYVKRVRGSQGFACCGERGVRGIAERPARGVKPRNRPNDRGPCRSMRFQGIDCQLLLPNRAVCVRERRAPPP